MARVAGRCGAWSTGVERLRTIPSLGSSIGADTLFSADVYAMRSEEFDFKLLGGRKQAKEQ